MGCTSSVPAVDSRSASRCMSRWRGAGIGNNILLLGIKEQDHTGKLFLSGAATANAVLVASLEAMLRETGEVTRTAGTDEEELLWDIVFTGLRLTCGHQAVSKQSYFPLGRRLVRLFDTLAAGGWVPSAATRFGGPFGHVYLEWPLLVMKKDDAEQYAPETLLLAVKDQKVRVRGTLITGKVCFCGPPHVIELLKTELTQRLRELWPETSDGFDEYETCGDWDWVLRIPVTSSTGNARSKLYFPKGNVILAMCEVIYSVGWRLVASPNFGGDSLDWPCLLFKRPTKTTEAPALIFGALCEDTFSPSQLCLSGRECGRMAEMLRDALQLVEGNEQVVISANVQEYYDCSLQRVVVAREHTESRLFRHHYFPRKDCVLAITDAMGGHGWRLAACPNFGASEACWPCFLWEYTGERLQTAMVAMEQSGKVSLGADTELWGPLLVNFRAIFKKVQCALDDFDHDYDFAFRHARITTGEAGGNFPHGFPVELLAGELGRLGWAPAGGPSFGSLQLLRPSFLFQRPLVDIKGSV